ncbi:MAG: YbaB/EbfC family nucleoid-associated protein [bacterium]|jgi:DNA-binding YbaB/EbfC family protein
MKMPKMPGMGNINQLMQQVQDAARQAQEMEEKLAAERFETSAGGGMVKATFNGVGSVLEIKIDPQVVDPDDVEMLQDLVVSAMRDGQEQAAKLRQKKVEEITGNMPNIPGLNMPM